MKIGVAYYDFSSGFMQVLFDLFHHDMRLWKAYAFTLQVSVFKMLVIMRIKSSIYKSTFYNLFIYLSQSYPTFAEYQDLLEALEERLPSAAHTEEK